MNGKITQFKLHLKVRGKKTSVTKEFRNSWIHEGYSKSLKLPDEYFKTPRFVSFTYYKTDCKYQ